MGALRVPVPLLPAAALLVGASTAHAFSTASAFTDPCHESLTLRAFQEAEPVLPLEGISIPQAELWDRAAGVVFEAIPDVDARTERDRFFFFSLFLGVRAPDTEGSSSTNVQNLRGIHAHPEGQYDHCLRAPEDDGAAGDAHTHAACLAVIHAQLERARETLQVEEGGAILQVPMTLDHYGTFEVPVWGPAYHIGRALHASQDSFTHTVRSEDLRTIYHHANFIDAIEGEHDESRDGLAHSDYADRCGAESEAVADATVAASAELLRATATFLDGTGDGDAAVATALGAWMGFQEGCGIDADFCGSPWEERARREPTTAYLGCAVAAPLGAPGVVDRSAWVLGALGLALAARRARRRGAAGHVVGVARLP